MNIQKNQTRNIQKEGEAVLFGFRLLSEEEQRIAYACLCCVCLCLRCAVLWYYIILALQLKREASGRAGRSLPSLKKFKVD